MEEGRSREERGVTLASPASASLIWCELSGRVRGGAADLDRPSAVPGVGVTATWERWVLVTVFPPAVRGRPPPGHANPADDPHHEQDLGPGGAGHANGHFPLLLHWPWERSVGGAVSLGAGRQAGVCRTLLGLLGFGPSPYLGCVYPGSERARLPHGNLWNNI